MTKAAVYESVVKKLTNNCGISYVRMSPAELLEHIGYSDSAYNTVTIIASAQTNSSHQGWQKMYV